MKRNAPVPLAILSLFLGMSLVSCSSRASLRAASRDIPVATVRQLGLQLQVNTTGQLRTTRTAPAIAPPVAGGTLQIIHLLKTGAAVKAGEVVVAFDPSEQEYKLAQSRSDYAQAEQEIVKARDDAAVQTAQDQTALLKAKFDVRQAELDVSKNPILSAIDAQKNALALKEANRALAQLQQDIRSHGASNQAGIDVAEEKKQKALLAIAQAEKNIQNMQVRSPIDGLVVVRENQNASGGFFWGGMTLPPYQEGDQTYPGSVVAEVIDLSHMEISATVKESERAAVKAGQMADVQVDAFPGLVFHAKVESVAGMVSNMWFDDPGHNFDVTLALARPDPTLRPGFSAHLVIFGDHLDHALSVPQQAVFHLESKPEVYVKTGKGFEPRQVSIRYLTEGRAVVEGLTAGAEVALVNPEESRSGRSKPAAGGVGLP